MKSLVKLNAAKQGSRKKGKESVAGVFVRNNILYVRKRINGKLIPYSTGKKDNEANRRWVEYHSESIWAEKSDEARKSVLLNLEASPEQTLEDFGAEYYKICPDTRDLVSNDRLKNDFLKYVVPILGKMKLSEITASHIEAWQLRMKYYPDPTPDLLDFEKTKERRGYSRIKNLKSALTLVLNQAVLDGKIAVSPAANVKLVKKASKRRSISIQEAETMADEELEDIFTNETVTYCEDKIKHFIQLCDKIIAEKQRSHHRFVWTVFKHMIIFKFYSGVRSGEAIALMWKYVDFENRKIRIQFTMRNGELKLPKENKTRVIDMLPEAETALLALKKLTGRSAWVFLTMRKAPYSNPFGPSRLWSQLLKKANAKKVRFYNTRHSFVTNMMSRGLNTEWLIQQLGHESIVITRQHYEGNIEPEWEKLKDSLAS